MTEIINYLNSIAKKNDLTSQEIMRVFQIIINNGATPAQISAFIMGISTKGESISEIIGSADILRQKITKKLNLNNISNYFLLINNGFKFCNLKYFAVSLIIAAAGYKILNVSDNENNQDIISGLADMGIKYEYNKALVEESINNINHGLIIPSFYDFLPVDLVIILKEISVPNIINIVNPLIYRFNNISQIIKLSSLDQFKLYIEILKILDLEKVWLVYNESEDNLFSLTKINKVASIYKGEIEEFEIDLKEFSNSIEINNTQCADLTTFQLLRFLDGYDIYQKESIIIDAAMCIYFLSEDKDIQQSINVVNNILYEGKAKLVLKKLVEMNNNFSIKKVIIK